MLRPGVDPPRSLVSGIVRTNRVVEKESSMCWRTPPLSCQRSPLLPLALRQLALFQGSDDFWQAATERLQLSVNMQFLSHSTLALTGTGASDRYTE